MAYNDMLSQQQQQKYTIIGVLYNKIRLMLWNFLKIYLIYKVGSSHFSRFRFALYVLYTQLFNIKKKLLKFSYLSSGYVFAVCKEIIYQ